MKAFLIGAVVALAIAGGTVAAYALLGIGAAEYAAPEGVRL